jgi:hypothetical protein
VGPWGAPKKEGKRRKNKEKEVRKRKEIDK